MVADKFTFVPGERTTDRNKGFLGNELPDKVVGRSLIEGAKPYLLPKFVNEGPRQRARFLCMPRKKLVDSPGFIDDPGFGYVLQFNENIPRVKAQGRKGDPANNRGKGGNPGPR